jgi:hypothetical protein
MALRLAGVCLLLSLPYSSCGETDRVTVQFYIVDGYGFSQAERDLIQDIADSTAIEVEQLLPTLPTQLILKVQAGRVVSPDTGEAASVVRPNTVRWTVDPHRTRVVSAIAQAELRRPLFPVWYYLVRTQTLNNTLLMDQVIVGQVLSPTRGNVHRGCASNGGDQIISGLLPLPSHCHSPAEAVAYLTAAWRIDKSRHLKCLVCRRNARHREPEQARS